MADLAGAFSVGGPASRCARPGVRGRLAHRRTPVNARRCHVCRGRLTPVPRPLQLRGHIAALRQPGGSLATAIMRRLLLIACLAFAACGRAEDSPATRLTGEAYRADV